MALNASRLSDAMHRGIRAAAIEDPKGQLKAFCDALAAAIVTEVTTNAEIPQLSVTSIPVGAVAVGAGAAAAPNPAPIPLSTSPLPPGRIR